jgi:glycosyltransferase involved in cell wall biosynthesis
VTMPGLSALHVVANSVVGGAERHVLDLVTGLRDRGCTVTVVCPRAGPLTDALAAARVPFRLIGFVHQRPGDEYALDTPAAEQLEQLIRDLRPTVVHSHLYPAHLHATVAGARAGVPALLTTAHTLVVRPGDKWLTQATPVHTIACAQDVAKRLQLAGLPADRISVVANGVAWPHQGPLTPGAPRSGVLAVARLSPEKGLDVLLAAARLVADAEPSAHFTIAGEGPETRSLLQLRHRLNLTASVRFLGVRHDIAALLRSAAVFVSPSRQEAGPLAVLEAMAAGAAVLATAVGGTPEVVIEDETGLLVVPEDPDALAAGLLRLLTDRALRARLGDTARQAVLRDHTLDHQVEQTIDVYRRLLVAGAPAGGAGLALEWPPPSTVALCGR